MRITQRIRLIRSICNKKNLALVSVAYMLTVSGVSPLAATESLSQTDHLAGRYSISVGIETYTHDDLPRLHYAIDDAELLSGVLESQGYKSRLLVDYQTNPADLLSRIVDIGDELENTVGRENGTLVITYAGHGFQQDNQNFLAMGNADPENLSDTSLSIAALTNVLAASGIGRQILLIDACRSNPVRSIDGNDRVFVEQSVEASGLSVLFSSSPGQPSYEYGSINNGVFSHFAAKALEGGAANSNGWVTVSSLFNWVREEVIRFNHKNDYPSQIPWQQGDNSGDMRIGFPLRLGSQPVLPEAAPASEPPGSESGGFSFWKLAATVVGIIVVGITIDNSSSGTSDDSGEPAITVLVPTP